MLNDSLLQNESAPIEEKHKFLTSADWFPPDVLFSLELNQMLEDGLVLSPKVIHSSLCKALDFLTHIEGPNLDYRRYWGNNWLQPWIALSSEYINSGYVYPYHHSGAVKTTSQIGKILTASSFTNAGVFPPMYGALFMAGSMEMNTSHMNCIEYLHRRPSVIPVIALEKDSYLLGKERRAPFLPLSLRISMLDLFLKKYFPGRSFISVNTGSTYHYGDDDVYIDDSIVAMISETRVGSVFLNSSRLKYFHRVMINQIGRFDFTSNVIPNFSGPHSSDILQI